MSIRYQLFGIPKTFYEFVDKVQRRGDADLEIFVRSYSDGSLEEKPIGDKMFSYMSNTHYFVELWAGKRRFRLTEHTPRVGDFFSTMVEIEEVIRNTFVEAVKAAERLEVCGLEAKINGQGVEKVREAIMHYDKRIKSLGDSCNQ